VVGSVSHTRALPWRLVVRPWQVFAALARAVFYIALLFEVFY
jgi:hypothetical protein